MQNSIDKLVEEAKFDWHETGPLEKMLDDQLDWQSAQEVELPPLRPDDDPYRIGHTDRFARVLSSTSSGGSIILSLPLSSTSDPVLLRQSFHVVRSQTETGKEYLYGVAPISSTTQLAELLGFVDPVFGYHALFSEKELTPDVDWSGLAAATYENVTVGVDDGTQFLRIGIKSA